MVVAGPGTGKTTMLTLRIANILKKVDVQPEQILALTFTNSGVHAMRTKLIEYIGDEAYRVGIFTFHSFAEYVIKEFPSYFEDLAYAEVIRDIDKVRILESILEAGTFTELVSVHDPFRSIRDLMGAIDQIKREGITSKEYAELIPTWEESLMQDDSMFYKRAYGKFKAGDMKPAEEQKIRKRVAKAREVGVVYEAYQEALQKKGRYDFNDMMLRLLAALEEHENLRLDLGEQYQYLLVDEHQDTNEGQNRLIELLSSAEHLEGRPNVCTVGDEKQSIYRFQGASEETFAHFSTLFKDVAHIHLKENYRSTKNILEASHSLIKHTLPDAVSLTPTCSGNAPVAVHEFSNYKFELLYVAHDIEKKIKEGVSPENIAVMYRSNKHAREIVEVFDALHIPHTVLSKSAVFEDVHIDNLITLLRVIDNPKDNYHLAETLFIDFLGFDGYEVVETLATFRKKTKEGNTSLFQVLQKEDRYNDFLNMLTNLKMREKNASFGTFVKEFLEESGYLSYMLGRDDSQDRLLRLDSLLNEIKRQELESARYRLSDFLAFIDAYKKYGLDIQTGGDIVREGVQCMTAHRSKGLEFAHVYMVNTTRHSWEKSGGGPRITLPIDDYRGTIDDERRLFYVAMTRAKESLTISSSRADFEGRERERSQFITELDEACISILPSTTFESEYDHELAYFVRASHAKHDVFDPQYLKQLFLKRNLSVTALNNYIACPIRYLFRNLIQLPGAYAAPLVYGDAIHRALEKFFETSREAQKIQPVSLLQTSFQDTLGASSMFGAEYERYLKKGEADLAAYYEQYAKNGVYELQTKSRLLETLLL